MRIHVKKIVDNIYYFFSRTDAVTIVMSKILNVLPKGKSTSDSNLILTKFFMYTVGSSSFITLIFLLVSSFFVTF